MKIKRMASSTQTLSPSKKPNGDKCDSSSNFSDVTFSKVTFRTHKSKKKSKRSQLSTVCEEADDQFDSNWLSNKASNLHNKTISRSGYVKKTSIDKNPDETVFKTQIGNVGVETQVENDEPNVKEEHQKLGTTNNNSCRKLNKHKKKKKYKLSESYIEPLNDTEVPRICPKEKSEKTKQSKIKIINIAQDSKSVILNKSDASKAGDFSTMDSPVTKSKHGKSLKKKYSFSQFYLDHAISDIDMKTEETVCRNHFKIGEEESQDNNEDVNEKDEKEMFETTNSNSYRKLKKHKRKKKHKYPESYIESLDDTVVLSSTCSKEKNEITQPFEMNKTHEGLVLNQSDAENAAILYKMGSQVAKPNDGKSAKRKLSLSRSYPNTISDESDTNLYSTTNLNESIQYVSNNMKCRSKNRSSSKEPTNKSCEKINMDSCEFGENEELQCHASKEVSEYNNSDPASNSRVSSEMFSNLANSKEKKSYIPNNKPKKRRESSSPWNFNEFSANFNENNHCDAKNPIRNEEDMVKLSKKHKRSLSTVEILYEKGTQQFPETVAKPNSQEVNNEVFSIKTPTSKNKVKEAKVKTSTAINLLNNKIFESGQNKKDIIAEALNNVSSKSVKHNLLNESIIADGSKINRKPKSKPLISKVSSCDSSTGNDADKNLSVHPITVFKNKRKNGKCIQNTTQVSKNEPLDKDKILQDLLSAALKSINKSPGRKKVNGPVNAARNYKELNEKISKKGKEKVSKMICKVKKGLQSKTGEIMSNQILSQPSTSQVVKTVCKVKSNKKPKALILHETSSRGLTFKTVQHKSKLKKIAKLDVEKMQQFLLAEALKKVKSVPILENNTSGAPELHQDNNTNPTSKTKYIGKVKKKSNTVFKNKLISKSIQDPLEDFAAKLLSAELKKRKEGLNK